VGDGGRRWPVRFEVDALSWAPLDGVDGSPLESARDCNARVIGVGEHRLALMNVADAIFEDDEQLRTVVDAQPGTGAAVLVDPDPHRSILPCPLLDGTTLAVKSNSILLVARAAWDAPVSKLPMAGLR
jgi:hypothetical protein